MKTLDTPPATDFDSSTHGLDTDMDSLSISEMDAISEASYSEAYENISRPPSAISEWSENEADRTFVQDHVHGFLGHASVTSLEHDADGEESDMGIDLSQSISSLSFREPDEMQREQMNTDTRDSRQSIQRGYTPFENVLANTAIRYSTQKKPSSRFRGKKRSSQSSFYNYLFE